ncbi:hypothetical protein, partial [Grimontia indica]|uniref:hypothetical protein n=1 Tax=Grimontia indica TaxID=1056512 RepID=UPI000586E23F
MERQKLAILINMAMLAPLSSWASVPQNVDERWQQPTITTHPDKPYYPNSNVVNRKNLFDWRTQHYQIGMGNLHGAEEFKLSPFYICEIESLYNVPGGKILTDDIMGPNGEPAGTNCARSISKSILDKVPDMDPNEGWEILKFNLGYKMSHYENAKETWSADGNDSWSSNQYPYIILYNRLTAKLRVMSYMGASDIGTGLSVKMSVKGKAKIFNTNQSSDARFYQESV